MSEITSKLLNLISDENFIRIKALSNRPNFFKIVGRTYTETWHSMFLAWLLDPMGSHNLSSFPLQRLLVLVSNPYIFGRKCELDRIAKFATIADLTNAKIKPNEGDQREYSCDVGKFDIFIEIDNQNNDEKVVILIEQKVNSLIDKTQAKKYIDWLDNEYFDWFKIPVYLASSNQYSISSEDTFNSSRWYGIDYQQLHDIVLMPLLNHPTLNSQISILIEQYIDVLRIPDKGRKLAVTEEEKELALQLYDKHREAFETIQAALSDFTDVSLVPVTTNNILVLVANGKKIIGNTVPEFYDSALKFILESNINVDKHIPFETSKKRYLISRDKKHPGGNDFRAPIEYKGYFMEAHKSKEAAIKALAAFLKNCDIKVELDNN